MLCLNPSIACASAFCQHHHYILQEVDLSSPLFHRHHSGNSVDTKQSFQTFDRNVQEKKPASSMSMMLEIGTPLMPSGGGYVQYNLRVCRFPGKNAKSAVVEAAFRFRPKRPSTRWTCEPEYGSFVGSRLNRYALHLAMVALGICHS